jgi:hypothetical protein
MKTPVQAISLDNIPSFMRLSKIIVSLLASALLSSADTLQLKTGTTLTGTYMGGTGRELRFATGDQVRTFHIEDVQTLTFGDIPAQGSNPGPGSATAPAAPAPHFAASSSSSLVSANSNVVVRLIDSIDSKKDHLGQTFRASLDQPLLAANGTTFAARGTDCVVALVAQKQAGHFTGQTEMSVALQSLSVNNQVINLASTEQKEASASQGTRSAETVGGMAGVGAIIGALAGGGRGAAIGAGSGAAAGSLTRVLISGPRVRIPAETRLQFTLVQPIHLP